MVAAVRDMLDRMFWVSRAVPVAFAVVIGLMVFKPGLAKRTHGGPSMPFEWLKFLHVVTIIGAVTLAEGTILVIMLAARRRDVVGLRVLLAAGEVSDRASTPLVLLAIAFGIAAALAGQISLTAPWLVASYVLLVVGFAGLGLGGGFRHLERIKEAASASPEDAPSAELVALLDHRWTALVTFVPPLLMATLVFLMVVKPALW